ncbi:MAG: hypothetical protein ABMA64_06725 [Myxococcota bacterium]
MLLGFTSAAWAGVWVRPGGEVYAQVGWTHQQSSQIFDASGALRPQTDPRYVGSLSEVFSAGRYRADELSTWVELGLGHGFELFGSLPLRHAATTWTFTRGSDTLTQPNTGFGDASAGARFGGTRGPFAGSIAAAVRAPLYDNAPEALGLEAENLDFYDDQVPLGPGTIDVDLSVAGGYGAQLGWAQLELGARARDRGYSEALTGRLQLGAKPAPAVAGWVGLAGVASLGNGRAPDRFVDRWGRGPPAIDAQSWLEGSIGASWTAVGGFGPLAGITRTLTGARFPAVTTTFVGVSWTAR